MISLSQSLNELDRALELQMALVNAYKAGIVAVSHYAVELDPQITPPHRQHLTALASAVSPPASAGDIAEWSSALRNELRDYRDRAAEYLNALHTDLADKAATLHRIFEAMAAGDGEHEQRMVKTLDLLREIAADPRSEPVRPGLLSAADALAHSLEELKRQNQLTVAQFLMEIQVLHRRIESLQTAAAVDSSTRLMTRSQFEAHIAEYASKGSPFSVLLLKARNLRGLHRQFGDIAIQGLLSAFSKRLRNCIPSGSPAGRWGEDQFAVLLEQIHSLAWVKARSIAEHVGGTYVCMVEGKPLRPVLNVDVGVVDGGTGDSTERLIRRADEFFA